MRRFFGSFRNLHRNRKTFVHWERSSALSPANRFVQSRSLRLECLEDRSLLSFVPTGVDLMAISDSGVSNSDDITNLDNSSPGKNLQFEVSGTSPSATVLVYADGTLIGSAEATGDTTTVSSDGSFDLIDGNHAITARQFKSGQGESEDSPALDIMVDTVGPSQLDGQIAKLLTDDGANSDGFGKNLSIDGNRAIIGADYDDDNGLNSGSVYIFEDAGLGWTQTAKLTAIDGEREDYFGRGVSISGNIAIVGAYRDDDNGSDSGSAYIFEYAGSGWTQVAKLMGDDTVAGDYFGFSVSISGTVAVVGAQHDDDHGNSSGSAYIFEDTGSGWTQVAKLIADDGSASDQFGQSVAISGNRIIVGASNDNTYSGSVYIFEDTGTGWSQVAKLTADDAEISDYFGCSVAISGNMAVVGAYGDDGVGSLSGSAYIFEDTGSGWTQTNKLTVAEGESTYYFGYSVSISGDTAIVGAYRDDDNGSDSGSAYIFSDTGSGWVRVSKLLAADGAANDYFGYCVSISDNVAMVGAYGDDDLGNTSGSVYVIGATGQVIEDTGKFSCDRITSDIMPEFTAAFSEVVHGQNSDVTVLDPNLTPIVPDSISGWGTHAINIAFTTPLSIDGQYTVIIDGTSSVIDTAGNPINGGVDKTLTFTLDTQAPDTPVATDLQTLSDSGVSDTDNITNDDTPTFSVVGAPYTRLYRDGIQIGGDYEGDEITVSSLADGTYIFTVTAVDTAGNESAQSAPLSVTIDTQSPNALATPDLQAGSDSGVSNMDNNTNDATPTFDATGAPYFRLYRDGDLVSDPYETGGSCTLSPQRDGTSDYTATAVDTAGNESSPSSELTVTIDTVKYFKGAGQLTKLLADDGYSKDYFGHSVSVSGNTAIIGAYYDDDKGTDSGSAYVFENAGFEWAQVAKLTANDGAWSDHFGCSVAISGNVAIVGAYGDDDNGSSSGSAYIFEDTGSGWTQVAKLTADDGAANDLFGYSVSISGTTAIIGSQDDDDNGGDSGSAYIFEDTGTGWVQVAKLTADDGATGDSFGYSVSIHGTTAIIGANEDDDNGYNSGSAYIFENQGSGWIQTDKVIPDDYAGSRFGHCVSIHGNVAIVGKVSGATEAAYIFENTGSGWNQTAKLIADDGGTVDYFGRSVSISDNIAIVGAYRDADDGFASGSAYIFEDTGSGWSQIAKLTANDGEENDWFGYGVSIDGETAIIGAYGDDDSGDASGSAYLFGPVFPLDLWATSDTGASDTDNITSDNTPTFETKAAPYFRVYRDGVKISGDYEDGAIYTAPVQPDGTYEYTVVAVDAAGNESDPSIALNVTIDTENPDVPAAPDLAYSSDRGVSSTDDITSDSTPTFTATGSPYFRLFRDGVQISGDFESGSATATLQSDGTCDYSITAVDAAGNVSGQSAPLSVTVDTQAPDPPPAPDLQAGSDLGISDTDNITNDNTPTFDIAAVPYFRVYQGYTQISGDYESGTSYTTEIQPDGTFDYSLRAVDVAGNASFSSDPLSVTIDTACPIPIGETAELVADDEALGGLFGSSISISGNTAVVGAPTEDANGYASGAAYVFENSGSGWEQVAKLLPDDVMEDDYFGCSVSIDGDRIIVGAYNDDNDNGHSGSAYIFEDTGSGWTQVAKLIPTNSQPFSRFGISVSIDDSVAVIGAITSGNYIGPGSAYVFADTGAGWEEVAELTADDGYRGDYFGTSVSISESTIIVGSAYDDDQGYNSGSAYIFENNGSEWIQAAKLTAIEGQKGYWFGRSVSISDSMVVVGAPGYYNQGYNSGSAYVFENTGSGWSQVTKLIADGGRPYDYFGACVSIDGSTIIAGGVGDQTTSSSGSAYIFEDKGSGWTQVVRLAGNPVLPGDRFGNSVAISGSVAMVGAPYGYSSAAAVGSVHIYDLLPQLEEDTGISPDDYITSDTAPELIFTFSELVYGQDEDVIVLDPDNVPVSPDAITGWETNSLNIAFSTPLTVDGQYSVTLPGDGSIIDTAGNPLGNGIDQTLTFTLDTVAPDPSATLDLQSHSDTGTSNTDNITADSTPTFDIIGASTYRVYRDGLQISGDCETGPTFTATTQPDGTYDYSVRAVDDAGNESGPGDPLTVTIDTLTPHWLPGDANLDDIVNEADATILAAYWQRQSGVTWLEGDFNDDGRVNDVDATIMAVNWLATRLPGDANGDGLVDVCDLGILAANYNAGDGFDWEDADFTGDGKVDVSDLGILAASYGSVAAGTSNATATSSTAASAAIASEPELEPVTYDLDNDGRVGLGDLAFFASVYGEKPGVTTDSPYAYVADFDRSGTVDLGDLALFSANYRADEASDLIANKSVTGQAVSSAPETVPTAAVVPALLHAKQQKVADNDLAIIARHWMMAVDDMDDDDNEEDARDSVFAAIGATDEALGLLE
ncbi:MAG: hypothetical protein JXM70_16340 [Pirellulales bacterium]|nr:hypothetical protein [Pirellulales bacterium]